LKDETTWNVIRTDDDTTIWTTPTGDDYPNPPPEPYPIDETFLEDLDPPVDRELRDSHLPRPDPPEPPPPF
jgi:hypothetical protein